MAEQSAFPGGADPADPVEDGGSHRPVAAVAVEGDREPMGLVAHALEDPEGIRALLEQDRIRAARHEDLLDPLGEADHRHAALEQRLERLHARRELALAPVDHDQVREGGEAGVPVGVVRRDVRLLHVAAEAPR
jgi:hypothetical protein